LADVAFFHQHGGFISFAQPSPGLPIVGMRSDVFEPDLDLLPDFRLQGCCRDAPRCRVARLKIFQVDADLIIGQHGLVGLLQIPSI